jgi:antitoxin HicB
MKNDTERKDLKFYLNLRYPITMHSDPDGGYVAEVEELPGCMTQAETIGEALKAIEDARQLWIKTAYEEGLDIPLPRDIEEYSGKFMVRIPRSLHRTLARIAKQEGVSLNQYIASLLAAGARGDIVAEKMEDVLSKIRLLAQPRIAVLLASFGAKEEPRQFAEIRKLPQQKLARR